MESDANLAERNLAARLTSDTMLRELLFQGKLKPQTFWGFDFFDYIPKVEIVHSECNCPPSKNEEEFGILDLLGYYDKTCQTVNICEQRIAKYLKDESTSDYLFLREVIRLHEHAHAIIDTCSFNGFSAPSHEWFVSLPPAVGEPLAQFIVWSLLNSKDGEKPLLINTFERLNSNQPQIYQDWEKIKDCVDNWKKDPLMEVMLKNVINCESVIPLIVKFARTKEWNSFGTFEDELIRLNSDEIMEAFTFRLESEARGKAERLILSQLNEQNNRLKERNSSLERELQELREHRRQNEKR